MDPRRRTPSPAPEPNAPPSEGVAAVFVYGTLQRGQCRESCWPHSPESVCEGFIRAELYDLGPYPAITAGADWVRGELHRLRAESLRETLRVLDEIEEYVPGGSENLYERMVVPVYSAVRKEPPMVERAYAYFMLRPRLPAAARRITAELAARWPV